MNKCTDCHQHKYYDINCIHETCYSFFAVLCRSNGCANFMLRWLWLFFHFISFFGDHILLTWLISLKPHTHTLKIGSKKYAQCYFSSRFYWNIKMEKVEIHRIKHLLLRKLWWNVSSMLCGMKLHDDPVVVMCYSGWLYETTVRKDLYLVAVSYIGFENNCSYLSIGIINFFFRYRAEMWISISFTKKLSICVRIF